METGQPSRTAYAAARHRAAHQVHEGGSIFDDPLAGRILGATAEALQADASRRGMRLFIAARTRVAEDALAAAVEAGRVQQLVVLGAGLDTYAYRSPFPQLRIVEVDHPDTQAWKRDRLAQAGIGIPATVSYLGVDFETESLADRLRLTGPAFFFWLGVVPYLTRQGFDETLAFVAAGAGNEVVFDYAQSPERMPPERRAALLHRAERVARIGEPWLTYLEPQEIAEELSGLGFTETVDLGPAALAARFFDRHDVPADTPGGHVLHARR